MEFSCNTTRRFSGALGQSWSWSFSAICLLWDLQEAKSHGPFIAGCYGTVDKLFRQSREMEYLPLGVKPFIRVDHIKPTWYLGCRKLGSNKEAPYYINQYTHTHIHVYIYIYIHTHTHIYTYDTELFQNTSSDSSFGSQNLRTNLLSIKILSSLVLDLCFVREVQ